MLVLGMTGPIGHGKTTFANTVAAQEPTARQFESSLLISEVANAWQATLAGPIDPTDLSAINGWLRQLPAIVLRITHATAHSEGLVLDAKEIGRHPVEYQKLLLHLQTIKHNFNFAQQQIDVTNKETYRPLLQWLGGFLVKNVDPGIWWNELVRRIQAADGQGCKLAIASALRFPNDADIIRQTGAKVVKVYRPDHLQNDLLDPTERERETIIPDCTIINDGSLEQLQRTAQTFYQDLLVGKLRTVYTAKRQ